MHNSDCKYYKEIRVDCVHQISATKTRKESYIVDIRCSHHANNPKHFDEFDCTDCERFKTKNVTSRIYKRKATKYDMGRY